MAYESKVKVKILKCMLFKYTSVSNTKIPSCIHPFGIFQAEQSLNLYEVIVTF